MLTLLAQYGLFLAKALTLVMCILLTVAGIAAIRHKKKPKGTPKPRFESLNARYHHLTEDALTQCDDKDALKRYRKAHKASQKNLSALPRLFVLDFTGDIKAKSVAHLREEVTAILLIKQPKDAVLVRIESPGGVVHAYGLAAAQLDRLRQAGMTLTASVDKMAASGGYLMAAVADHIIAAPFAIVGSIGVVGQMPNFHRFLQKHDVDFEQITAGQYKRTLTVLGKNTEEGRSKFQEDVNEAHQLFKDYVHSRRPHMDIDTVGTGEYWHAAQALPLALIDEIVTSDDWLMQRHAQYQLMHVQCPTRPTLAEKLSHHAKHQWQHWCAATLNPYH